MFFLKLLIRNAFRARLRAALTVLGLVIAVVAFGLLQTMVGDWYQGVETASANRLIEMVGRMRRATLELLGRDRANAMLSLVDATPADDTVDEVVEATLTLPSGDKLVVADASTAEIYAAAKAFRDARPAPKGKAPKGFTTTADERARYARAAKRWQRDDVKALVDARLVASRKAHGAIVRVEMPLAIWEQLRPPKA